MIFSLTSNCGIMKGGDIVNRVPDYAKLNIDIRSVNAKQINLFLMEIINKIKELKKEYKCEIKIKKLLEIPPLQEKI